MIEVRDVTKKFKSKENTILANDRISLKIGDGQIYGILGQNGSGKTTLINQITGLYRIDEGDILISGQSIRKNPKAGRTNCSVQAQGHVSFGELTPRKIVTLMGEFRGGRPEQVKQETEMLFQALAIEEWADKPGCELSGGIKRLTAFCMAAVCARDYIILDEPTNDVDPVRRKYLWQEIRKLAEKGCSVIVVTHNILELENVVDMVAIVNEGRIIREGTISDIKAQMESKMKMDILLTDASEPVELPQWAASPKYAEDSFSIALNPVHINEAISWVRELIHRGFAMSYSFTETTLEDVYINLIEKGA